jgi:serine/threonine protein kinase
LVSPLNEGGTLSSYRVSDQQSAAEVLSIIKDAARGLKDIQALGYVHGDIKGDNIFVDRCGRGFVSDLGLCVKSGQPIGVRTDKFVEGLVSGTPGHMSVEQMTGQPLLSEYSDVFSLGVTAIRAFTGQYPWGQFNSEGALNKMTYEQIEEVIRCFPYAKFPDYIPESVKKTFLDCVDTEANIPSLDQIINLHIEVTDQETPSSSLLSSSDLITEVR